MSKKWVYRFNELDQIEEYVGGSWDDVRGLLGGKGANLAEMMRIGLPVPDGFIITTEACNEYLLGTGRCHSVGNGCFWNSGQCHTGSGCPEEGRIIRPRSYRCSPL